MMLALFSGLAYSRGGFPEEYLPYADRVVFNGKVLTVAENFTIVEAFAVRDGKFQAVGKNQELLRLAAQLRPGRGNLCGLRHPVCLLHSGQAES